MSNLTLDSFKENMLRLQPDAFSKSYLLAVSGGIDSMTLLYLFKNLGFSFQVAHVNYHLRDEESNLDQKLVMQYCQANDITLHVHDVDKDRKKPQGSIQTWAREIRYNFFKQELKKNKLDFLITAHHLDDQIETFFINLLRGSGIAGLSGMPENKNNIVRPLLPYSRKEIAQFAYEHAVEYRDDKSNFKLDYQRNEIRHLILPTMEKIDATYLKRFEKSIHHLNYGKEYIDRQFEKSFPNLLKKENGSWKIELSDLRKEDKFLQLELLRRVGITSPVEGNKILTAKSGLQFKAPNGTLYTDQKNLSYLPDIVDLESFTHEKTEELPFYEIFQNKEDHTGIPKEILAEIRQFGDFSWNFDVAKLIFPLSIRHFREGDIIYPIGMIGKKKVSKFFKDEKVSILARPKIWLLCDGNDQVLGILPFRQDARQAAEDSTTNVFTITSNYN